MRTPDSRLWRRHLWRNRLQTLLLLGSMGLFLALLGWLLWGVEGLWILLIAGLFLLLFQPLITSHRIMQLYGARPLRPQHSPVLHDVLQELTRRADLPVSPDLYYLPSPAINAITVGRQHHAAIALSDGLLHSLGMREVIAVLAHEMAHVYGKDIQVMALADGIGRLTSMLSLFGQLLLLLNLPLLLWHGAVIPWGAIALLILAPYLSVLAQLGLSRSREYHADLLAVRLSGDAEGLALALLRIERLQGGWLERTMFPWRQLPLPSLLRTHPSTQERVQRLMALHAATDGDGWADSLGMTPPGLMARRGHARWHPGRWWY